MSSDTQAELARLFAEIAPRFGLSRAAGHCLAAIWRAAQAPSADDLVAGLGLSRSNVSVALKELRLAGLVQVARSPGSRRDFFTAEASPWALLRALVAERHRREIAPLIDRIAALEAAAPEEPRLAALAEMAETAGDWMARLTRSDAETLAEVMAADADRGTKKKKKKKTERP
ncbi:MAG: GbsR/MarR family transcriptional regulator [Paenirhodobacter sp.]|uniref:GbsR/MarR family transcriptional regulator n=1 Tax=Paenirhodobacter sp. TaxID=1965326 RepID=UPI003D0B35B5